MHLGQELKVKRVAFHLRSEVPHHASLADLDLFLNEVIADKYLIEGLEFFYNEVAVVKIWLPSKVVKDLFLDGLINFLDIFLFAIAFSFFDKVGKPFGLVQVPK
jgi:hypothetical protein